MTPHEKEHIENAIRHIQTATDVDPWAAEIAVESMRKRITPTSVIVENGWKAKNDIAIHIINEIRNIIIKDDSWTEDATTAVNEAADMAIKALKEQEWIPCSKRLPDIDEEVLVTYSIDRRKERFVYTANWSGEEWLSVWDEFRTLGHTITHHAWKNLPEPYNEDKK